MSIQQIDLDPPLIIDKIMIQELKRSGNDEFRELIQSHFGFSKFIPAIVKNKHS